MADNEAQYNDDAVVYDPYKHRPKKVYISNFGAFGNLVKSAAGTGLFAMPYAFSNVGLISGILGTILMGFVITTSLQLLMRTHYIMCVRTKQPLLNYDQVVAIAMTSGVMKGRMSFNTITIIVDAVMLICYLGIGAVYVVFVAGVIQECIDREKTIAEAYYALILVPFFLLLNMVKGLNALVPISIVGNLFLSIACIIGIVYAIKYESTNDWVLMASDIKYYPKFIGIVFFALGSPGMIIAIEHSMNKPWDYTKACGVLNWGMGMLIVIHVVVGSIGYYKWGNATMSNFILNHHELDSMTLIALIMQALAIYFTYGLQCYVPITILSEEYANKSIADGYLKGTPYAWEIIARIGVTLFTCISAAAIPKLHLYTNFIGSLCIGTLGFLFPIILYIISNCGNWNELKHRCDVATTWVRMMTMTATTTIIRD
ncbi:hypothetical protein PV325_002375 [Microctonus aethiopoides]|nr:hypothetical protein PV325_002375 [Microctonus aethiopoides]KAK0093874.1 hypothetical protein PV326_012430 [Microctonus aethiopoides]